VGGIDGCCGEGDHGWGCAYRSIQLIISNLVYRRVLLRVPSILNIQRTLVDSGFVADRFIGSNSVRNGRHINQSILQDDLRFCHMYSGLNHLMVKHI
jgi:hypothetical protein